ncbi:MAG: O-antigen ligase family protein [Kiritimatiellaeota bacterium]|nr:O-antigen ligase family protein [Kiritimatiellota bacterium]
MKGAGRTTWAEPWAYRLLLAALGAVTFSIALGQALLAASTVLLVIWLAVDKPQPSPPPLLAAALLFIAIALLTLGANAAQVPWNRIGKLFWFVTLPAAALLVRDVPRLISLLWAFALGCGVLAVKTLVGIPWGAWKLLQAHPDYAQNFLHALTLKGSMPDGQLLMLGLVATLGLLLIRRAEHRPLNGPVILLALQTAAFILNLKRGSWMVAGLLLVILILTKLTWKHTLFLLLAAVAALCLPPVQTRLLDVERDFDPAAGGRMTMWTRVAPALILQHPFGLGYGLLTNDRMRAVAPEIERDRNLLHNNMLQVLVETGWPGLAAYLLWMAWALVAAAQRLRAARALSEPAALAALVLLLMLLGLLCNGVVEYNFGTSRLMIVLGAILGAWSVRPQDGGVGVGTEGAA